MSSRRNKKGPESSGNKKDGLQLILKSQGSQDHSLRIPPAQSRFGMEFKGVHLGMVMEMEMEEMAEVLPQVDE